MLPQLARGDANKIWVIPSEFTQALSNLSGFAADVTERQRKPEPPPPPPITPGDPAASSLVGESPQDVHPRRAPRRQHRRQRAGRHADEHRARPGRRSAGRT